MRRRRRLRRPHRGPSAATGREVGRRPRGARSRRRPHLDPAALRRHSRRPRRRVARAVSRRDLRAGGRGRRVDVQDVGRRARTCSSTATASAATRDSSRRSARSRSLTIAWAQVEARPDGEAGSARRAVDGAARGGVGRAHGRRRTSSTAGSATGIGRDLFEMAVRGLFTGDLDDTSFLHLLFLVRAHGSINNLFSIEKGAQENLVDGGAGSIAQRIADELGDAVRLNAPVRSITQHDDHVVVDAGDLDGVGAPRRGHRSARARARDRVRPRAPRRSPDAVPQRGRRPGDEDARRLRRTVLARRRASAARPRSRARPSEVTLDASPVVGNARRHRVVHVRAGRRTRRRARSRRAAPRGRRRAHRPTRPAGGVAGRVHRDRVVEGGVDTRLLDGAPPARASSRATDRCSREPFGRVHWAGTETSTISHGAIDGAVRSGERAAAEILDRT